jgi:poly [ADP-ribose] polymerase
MMKRTMMEMEIDLDKMPLGALSRAQIEKGYKILSDLSLVLQDDDMDQATKQQRILSFSNQFYTIVPQNFGSHGMSDKHLIDSMEKLLKKRELVETLLEMEIAVSLSKGDSGSDANPIDASYKKLKADIKPVDKTAREFKLVPPPCTCVQRAICSMRAESGAHTCRLRSKKSCIVCPVRTPASRTQQH